MLLEKSLFFGLISVSWGLILVWGVFLLSIRICWGVEARGQIFLSLSASSRPGNSKQPSDPMWPDDFPVSTREVVEMIPRIYTPCFFTKRGRNEPVGQIKGETIASRSDNQKQNTAKKGTFCHYTIVSGGFSAGVVKVNKWMIMAAEEETSEQEIDGDEDDGEDDEDVDEVEEEEEDDDEVEEVLISSGGRAPATSAGNDEEEDEDGENEDDEGNDDDDDDDDDDSDDDEVDDEEDEEDLGTEYLVRPVAPAEEEEDASDFEPQENGEEDPEEGDDEDEDAPPSKRKRTGKDDSDDGGEDDVRPSKR